MWALLTSKLKLVGLGGLFVLLLALGVQTWFLQSARHQVDQLNTHLEEVNRDKGILQMRVTALETSRFIEDEVRQKLQQGTQNVRDAQQIILKRVTHEVDQIRRTTPLKADGEDGGRDMADVVHDSLRDAYCLAVPTATDCAAGRSPQGL